MITRASAEPDDDSIVWTNPSVRGFAGTADPLDKMLAVSRKMMAAAADSGLDGPPFDPFRLAEMLGLGLRARADVADARVNADTTGVRSTPDAPLRGFVSAPVPLVIEYNPTRPRGRMRYNLAHELAHVLFPDVAEAARHRTGAGAVPGYEGDDSWQLELLCNVAAAELLMPTEAIAGIVDIDPDIDFIMTQRKRYDVSTEALLRRLASATSRPLAVIAASRVADSPSAALRVEYVIPSRAFRPGIRRGSLVTSESVMAECVAVGQTAKGNMSIAGERLRVQAVGTPPYPGSGFARVIAITEPEGVPSASPAGLRFVTGDVTSPVTEGRVIVGHVTNNAAHGWARRGVAAALSRKFPEVARAYHYWSVADPDNLRLGNVHLIATTSNPQIQIASMVVQRSYGNDSPDRVVYTALAEALRDVGDAALSQGAEVHLPRIGSGQAGGRWDLVETIIDEELIRRGARVVIYTPKFGAGGRPESR